MKKGKTVALLLKLFTHYSVSYTNDQVQDSLVIWKPMHHDYLKWLVTSMLIPHVLVQKIEEIDNGKHSGMLGKLLATHATLIQSP
jgi:hypothetical protein